MQLQHKRWEISPSAGYHSVSVTHTLTANTLAAKFIEDVTKDKTVSGSTMVKTGVSGRIAKPLGHTCIIHKHTTFWATENLSHKPYLTSDQPLTQLYCVTCIVQTYVPVEQGFVFKVGISKPK